MSTHRCNRIWWYTDRDSNQNIVEKRIPINRVYIILLGIVNDNIEDIMSVAILSSNA